MFKMHYLNENWNFEKIIDLLQDKKRDRVLMLDYDGTLAPFKLNPSEAKPYPGVVEIINKIMENPRNRVVLVTGRWTADLKRLLNFNKQPEIWGTHGIERMTTDGDISISNMDDKALRGLAEADHWISTSSQKIRFEQKPGALAIHWRGEKEKAVKRIKKAIEPKLKYIAHHSGLLINQFDGGIELQVPGVNKGNAVKTVLSEIKKRAFVAYLGDDMTDENAFQVIKNRGLAVLVREEFRETQADAWLIPPDELLKFLTEWI